jgi:hypothetical protein
VVLGVRSADDRGGAGVDRPPLRSVASTHGLPNAGGPAVVPAPVAAGGLPAPAPALGGGEAQRRRIVRPPSPGEPGAKARS